MSFRLRNLAASLSFKHAAFSHHSMFTVLSNQSLTFTCRNDYLKPTQANILYKNSTRLFTREANTFKSSSSGNINKARTLGKDDWDVGKHPEEDRFGTLNNKDGYELKMFEEVYEVTEEDKVEASDAERVYRGRKNTPIWYSNQMKKLLKAGKLKEALDVLEVRMLKEDCVQPTEYNYDVLIGGCGRAGFTKKAFRLYNDMKKRGLQPTGVTYTALFNACAESPWPETDGITRLRKLHEQLQERQTKINVVTHHAMLKAYAKCGDVQTAFKLFHHLLESGVQLDVDNFVFLFFACASQKESGFLLAIEGWRHMLLKDIEPNLTTYNLLLRIVRDCGIGDLETANQVLLNSPTLKQKMIPAGVNQKRVVKLLKGNRQKQEQLDVATITDDVSEELSLFSQNMLVKDGIKKDSGRGLEKQKDLTDKSLSHIDNDSLNDSLKSIAPVAAKQISNHHNMLSLNPNLEGVMSLTAMDKPADRLYLIGGTRGLVESMTSNDVKPDCKTVTLLAEIIPRKKAAEDKLLKVVNDLEVKVDVDFYNMLIRKKTKRNDLAGAKALLADIKHKGLYPSMRTYVALASGCTQQKDGLQLLADVKAAGKTPTQPLYNALISAAHTQDDYDYVVYVLKDMEETKVWPDKRTIKQLENIAGFRTKQKKANPKLNGFRGFYTSWLEKIGYQNEKHPWSAYTNSN